jgi:PadR family transcriptional regulator PadR
MVLQTLDTIGPLHEYGIARRIEQISEEALQINQGTIYVTLMRLLERG